MTESVLESIEGVKTVRAYCYEKEDYKKTEEAILNSMLSSDGVKSYNGKYYKSLNEYQDLFKDLLEE